MKMHNISIDKKYFEPIRDGRISLLIFDKKVLKNVTTGDCGIASVGNYDVKFKILGTYIKAFEDITENEAMKAGFLTKDFLKESLINDFELKPVFSLGSGSNIDSTLFFIVEISTEFEEDNSQDSVKVNLYKNTYDTNTYKVDWEDLL